MATETTRPPPEALAGTPAQEPQRHRKLVRRLVLAVGLAFAFGFAMVPLYNVLCEVTGFNGKTRSGFAPGGLDERVEAGAPPGNAASRIDRSRIVTVEFTGTVMPGLPWEMRPLTSRLDLHPGELQQVRFLVHNHSAQPIVGQAVPSVSPGQAAQHFSKLDCFCFAQQTLAPGETRELPLTFILKPEIGADIRTVTLSYAFFNIAGKQAARTERE